MTEPLKPVGYGYEPDYGERWPDPTKLVAPDWCSRERPKIVAYLKSAPRIRDSLGYAHCRFPGMRDEEMGTGDLSDGRYVWPEGLWIYVERFLIRLPEDMVAHMQAGQFRLPTNLDLAALAERPVDIVYWEKWARMNPAGD